jgi:hypothetical protein
MGPIRWGFATCGPEAAQIRKSSSPAVGRKIRMTLGSEGARSVALAVPLAGQVEAAAAGTIGINSKNRRAKRQPSGGFYRIRRYNSRLLRPSIWRAKRKMRKLMVIFPQMELNSLLMYTISVWQD